MKSVRYIALLVTAALLLALLPTGAFAAPEAYDVWVNGVQFTEKNAAEGLNCGLGTAVYDPENAVLTLTDASVTKAHAEEYGDGSFAAAIFAAGDLTVAVNGENTVTSVFTMGKNVTNCGIFCGGTLTVEGLGTLTVTGGLSTYRTAGIFAADVIFRDSVAVNASGGRLTSTVATCGYGVYAAKDLTFTDNATVSAVSFLPDSECLPAVSCGLFAGHAITEELSAVVSAIANRSVAKEGDAVLVQGTVTVTGGSLTAKGVGEQSCGLRAVTDGKTPLRVRSGFLYATGGQYAVFAPYGKADIHGEYRVTGAAFANATELGCNREVAVDYEDGMRFLLTDNEETVDAKSLYFVRPVIAYGLWVGGLQVDNYNCYDIFGDGTAAYDKDSATLTLNGAQIGDGRYGDAYLYAENELTLRLKDGSNSTVGGLTHELTEHAYGIYAAKGLTVEGGGSLTVASGNAEKDAFGVYVRTGALKIAGAAVRFRSGDAADSSAGVFVASTVSGDCMLTKMASVSAASGKAAAMMGLSANGKISVTEGSVLSGEGGSGKTDSNSVSYGVRCGGAMDMDDSSSVKGVGGDSAGFSIGVYVLSSKDGITVRGGKLNALSGTGADKCYGLYAKTSVAVRRGELIAESADASGAAGSLSYAVTAKTVALSGGTVTATAGQAASSCCIYADTFTVAGAAQITAAANGINGHAMRKSPKYTSYAPVVYTGKEAPGQFIEKPQEADYVNNAYVRIEKQFKSEKIWYALPIYDASARFANRWIGFTSDDVTKPAQIGVGVEGTGAAEYYNGYIYGVTSTMPFRLWRVSLDGATLSAPEYIGDSFRFSFGDMSYDYVTDKMYGLGTFNMERALFSVDLRTGYTERALSVSGTDAELLTLAFNRAGECYGVDLAGFLYRISMRDGRAEKVGFTGLVPDGAQSMAFDRSTGELFWAYFNGQTGKSGFYLVNTETGEAVLAGKTGGSHMELAGLFTIPQAYDVWVGGVRVNEENHADVFGNGLVSFDPGAKTLTFNGMKITTYAQVYKHYSFGVLARDMDLTLVFNGENAIALEDVYTDYSASICVINGKATIKGGKLTILSTTAKLDNTILCPDGVTVEDCELLLYSTHNGITATADDALVEIRNSTVGIHAGHVGIASTAGSVALDNSTVAITADKDENVRASAVAALHDFTLKNSTFIATADTNEAVIAGRTDVTESAFDATGPENAVSGEITFFHKNGTAVVVANGKSEESRGFWDKTTPLTAYNYVKITECPHVYESATDLVCTVCGFIRHLTPDGETYLPGDVDNDGKITSADARLALRRSVQLEDFAETSAAYYACDADEDGSVTSADARLILRASVGLEEL